VADLQSAALATWLQRQEFPGNLGELLYAVKGSWQASPRATCQLVVVVRFGPAVFCALRGHLSPYCTRRRPSNLLESTNARPTRAGDSAAASRRVEDSLSAARFCGIEGSTKVAAAVRDPGKEARRSDNGVREFIAVRFVISRGASTGRQAGGTEHERNWPRFAQGFIAKGCARWD
jgi:hypothetical protein